MNIKKKKLQRILIVTLSNFGDVVLTLPVIASVKKAFPKAAVSIIIGEKAHQLLCENKVFSEVIVYQKSASLFEKIKFIMHLRRQRFDFVLDLRNTLIPFNTIMD